MILFKLQCLLYDIIYIYKYVNNGIPLLAILLEGFL